MRGNAAARRCRAAYGCACTSRVCNNCIGKMNRCPTCRKQKPGTIYTAPLANTSNNARLAEELFLRLQTNDGWNISNRRSNTINSVNHLRNVVPSNMHMLSVCSGALLVVLLVILKFIAQGARIDQFFVNVIKSVFAACVQIFTVRVFGDSRISSLNREDFIVGMIGMMFMLPASALPIVSARYIGALPSAVQQILRTAVSDARALNVQTEFRSDFLENALLPAAFYLLIAVSGLTILEPVVGYRITLTQRQRDMTARFSKRIFTSIRSLVQSLRRRS